MVAVVNLSEGSGVKAQDPIDLDALEAETSLAHASRSPPPVSKDFDLVAARPTEAVAAEKAAAPESLPPEDTGMMLLLRNEVFVFFLSNVHFVLLTPLVFALALLAKTLVTLSARDREKDTPQIETGPSASRSSLASVLGEPGMKLRLLLCF
jgi:hypothetical protein